MTWGKGQGKGNPSTGATPSDRSSKRSNEASRNSPNQDTNRQKNSAESLVQQSLTQKPDCFKYIAAQNQVSPPSSSAEHQHRQRQRISYYVSALDAQHEGIELEPQRVPSLILGKNWICATCRLDLDPFHRPRNAE